MQGAFQNALSIVKEATDTVTSSTTLVADSELILPYVPAGVPYLFTGQLITTCAAAGNIKMDLSAGTGTISYMQITSAFANAAGAITQGALQVALNGGANGGTTNITISVQLAGVIMLATPGSLGLKFAQQASSATGTTTGPGSFLLLESLAPTILS